MLLLCFDVAVFSFSFLDRNYIWTFPFELRLMPLAFVILRWNFAVCHTPQWDERITSKKNMGGGYSFEKAHFKGLPGTYPYHTPFRGHLIQTQNLCTFQNQLSDDVKKKLRNFGRNELGTLIAPLWGHITQVS